MRSIIRVDNLPKLVDLFIMTRITHERTTAAKFQPGGFRGAKFFLPW